MRSLRIAVAVAVLVASLGCPQYGGPLAEASDRVIPVRIPEPAYEQLFPYYAELCAVSRFHRLNVEQGGNAGHAVLYLKGVCRDEHAPYPTLRMCDPVVDDPRDLHHGVGISVNAVFKNVNWVAYPGRPLFFSGNLRRGELLDPPRFEQTLRSIVDQGLLRGVEARPERLAYLKTPRPPEDRLAEALIGTDVAIRFGRSVWCTVVPLERPQMERAVGYLNDLNRRYATTPADYEYSLYYDNCLRALHDSLAVAGVWEPRKETRSWLRQLLQLAVPGNEATKLAKRVTVFPLERFRSVADDSAMARSLRDDFWLPTRHGALLESAPVHRPNALYDTSVQIFVAEGPFASVTRGVQDLINDARFTELGPNLLYSAERYEQILAREKEEGPTSDPLRARYREYIAAQLDDARALYARLLAIDAPPVQPGE